MPPSAAVTVRNRCAAERVGAPYRPLIRRAITVFAGLWSDRLVAVHLLGSVARGEGVPGQSDIDFVALIEGDPSAADLEALEGQARRLADAHAIVSRVDLEALPAANLPAFRRFVLASDSVCVHGEDRHTTPVQSIDRATLADLVTPDATALIADYRLGIAAIEAGDEDAARFWSRIVGKDLLKCLRSVVLLRGGDYEQSIAGIYRQVGAFVPEASRLADLLIGLYREPTADLGTLRRALDVAEAELPAGIEEGR